MISRFIDIHPHIIADNEVRYPRSPLFGVQSGWSRDRPVNVDGLIAEMDSAGVDKAAVVQASTCYGFDNAYVVDSIAKYPDRLSAVGTVDIAQPDAPEVVKMWKDRGMEGLRLFTGGSTKGFDASGLEDPRTFPVWEMAADEGLSICIQTDPKGLGQVAGLARRFPGTTIVLDHLGRPDVSDGPPYEKADSLFELAAFENVYLKITPRIMEVVNLGGASSETFFPRLVGAFGAMRLAWGSNFPASEGRMAANLQVLEAGLSCLSADDRSWIFARTAQSLYPSLAD